MKVRGPFSAPAFDPVHGASRNSMSFAASSAHWWADQSLYDEYPGLDRFRYSPAFAVAVTPLAALGPTAGGILWVWLGMAVYYAGLGRYARDVRRLTLSLSRVEEKLDAYFHGQQKVALSLEEIKALFVESPLMAEWNEFRQARPDAVNAIRRAD